MIIEVEVNKFEFFDEDGVYAYIGVDIVSSWASFHSENIRWSHNIAKKMQKDWEELKEICRKRGVKELVASNANVDDKRWPKYIKLFGFPEPTLVSISKQEL